MKPQPKSRMGRPLKGEAPLTVRLEIRLEAGEKAAYDRAAKAVGLERAEWIRAVLNAAVDRILPKSAEGR